MRNPGPITRSLLVVPLLFALSVTGPAHAVEVIPLAYHFGVVEVGTSSSTIITLVNPTGHSHVLTVAAFVGGSSPDFSIATPLDLPLTIESMEELELEIVFAPSTPGLLLAELELHIIDNSLKIVTVSLQGGPGTAPPPGACAP